MIKNNLIRDNIGTAIYTGVYISGTNSSIINNTIVGNSKGITLASGSNTDIRNNIVVSNENAGIVPGSAVVDYNDVWNNASGNDPGPNGISIDPQFVDP